MTKRHIIDVSVATFSDETKQYFATASSLESIREILPASVNPDLDFINDVVGRYEIDEETGRMTIRLLSRSNADFVPMENGFGASDRLPSDGRLLIETDFLTHLYRYIRQTFLSIQEPSSAEDVPVEKQVSEASIADEPEDLFASMLGVSSP